MLDIKVELNGKKPPKIKFRGKSNDILNELMLTDMYVISFVLDNSKSSIKENIDTIDNYTNLLNQKLKERFASGINYGNTR